MKRTTRPRYPGGWNTLWPVAAYVLGYAFAYAVTGDRARTLLARTTITTPYSTYRLNALVEHVDALSWELAGFVFYNAHLVPATAFRLPDGTTADANLVLSADGPLLGLFVLPPVSLATAGAMATQSAERATDLRFDFRASVTSRYVVNGGLLCVGYLPVAVVGAAVVRVPLRGDAAMVVDLLLAVMLAGIVHPFVFGGLGALVHASR